MDSGWGGAPIEANVLQHHSPIGYSGVKSKMRKKVTTFANPPVDLVNMFWDDMCSWQMMFLSGPIHFINRPKVS
jgi:hypothetical protein